MRSLLKKFMLKCEREMKELPFNSVEGYKGVRFSLFFRKCNLLSFSSRLRTSCLESSDVHRGSLSFSQGSNSEKLKAHNLVWRGHGRIETQIPWLSPGKSTFPEETALPSKGEPPPWELAFFRMIIHFVIHSRKQVSSSLSPSSQPQPLPSFCLSLRHSLA